MIKDGKRLKKEKRPSKSKQLAKPKQPLSGGSAETSDQKKKYAINLKVFVKNLPNENKVDEIVEKHFESCGKIIDFHAYHMEKFKHILVVFSSEEEADRATLLTGSLIEGRHIIVSKHRQYAVPTSKTVTVSNLSLEIVEEDLWQFFEKCGTIKYIHIDRLLNAQSYNAQVHFKDLDSVNKAVKKEGKELKGNVISVRPHTSEDENDETSSCYPVFVSGLPMDIKKEDLMKAFHDCGKIRRIKMKALKCQQEEKELKQKATIFFMDEEGANKAVEHSGKSFAGCTVTQRETLVDHNKFPNPLFVAGIARETKDVDLFFKFQECGLFEKIHFLQSPKGFLKKCIIAFKEAESVKKALALKDLSLHGQKLVISDKKDILVGVRPRIKASKRTAAHIIDDSSEQTEKKKKRVDSGIGNVSGSVHDESLTSSSSGLSEAKKKKKKKSKTEDPINDESSEPTEGKKNKTRVDSGTDNVSGSVDDESFTSQNGLSEAKMKKKKKKKSKTEDQTNDEPTEKKKKRVDSGTENLSSNIDDEFLSASLNGVFEEKKKKKKKKSEVAG